LRSWHLVWIHRTRPPNMWNELLIGFF
jgi:hypothetical protein